MEGEESRNWIELPRDVTLMIMMKIEAFEILESIQFVCKLWYNLCKEPCMWRTIIMHNFEDPELAFKHQQMLLSAVHRSSGSLVHLDIEGFGNDDLLANISRRSSQLKQLRLACCISISASALIEAFEKFPLLEELELTLCPFSEEQILNIIRRCSTLKTFKLNEQGSKNPTLACDDEALTIAKCMPELLHLQLIGNSLTNDGLIAILDNCHHLQSLDLRACFHVNLDDDLRKRCYEQLKKFRHPNDPTDDYNYLTTDYDSDYDDIYAAEYDDMDYVSDDDGAYVFSDDNEFPYYEDAYDF